MNKKGTIIIFSAVIIALGLAAFLSYKLLNQPITDANQNIVNSNEIINNTVESNNTVNSNSIYNNQSVYNNRVSNTTSTQTVQTNIGPNTTDAKQKAINLVQNDWGEDSSVYFFVDEVNEDGKYVVSVRDKATTNAVVLYNVDVANNTVELQ